ncbi:MAG: LacI family transcriptional regulator [Planctomycetota bacterium]|jgi:LacI family transcriptional regulator|nr:LacI family transcriptional regulator [Planctomycetota bacterium]
MASIKDVAKRAGVSGMTASRVINFSGAVSARTRSLVSAAVKELDYRPNLTARSLRSQRSNLFGLLLPDIQNPVFAALAKHIEEEAQCLGYNVVLGNTWESPEREAQYLELMLARQMDGIIVAPVSPENDRLFSQCLVPVVVLDRTLSSDSPLRTVTVDNLQVGRLAARHFLSLGHRAFACMPGPQNIALFADRLLGFQEVVEAAGFSLELVIGAPTVGEFAIGSEICASIVSQCRKRPLALFCANDLTAIGAMREAQRRGLDVPGDLSIIGVDDIPSARMTMPALTTIRQPFPEIAAAGVRLLVEMLRDRGQRPKNIRLKPSLVVRESTAPVAAVGRSRPLAPLASPRLLRVLEAGD